MRSKIPQVTKDECNEILKRLTLWLPHPFELDKSPESSELLHTAAPGNQMAVSPRKRANYAPREPHGSLGFSNYSFWLAKIALFKLPILSPNGAWLFFGTDSGFAALIDFSKRS